METAPPSARKHKRGGDRVPDSALLLLQPGDAVALVGEAHVQVLQGAVDICGWIMTPASPSQIISSPITSSAIVLSAQETDCASAISADALTRPDIQAFATRCEISVASVVVVSVRTSMSAVQQAVCSLRSCGDVYGSGEGVVLPSLRVLALDSDSITPMRVCDEWSRAATAFTEHVRTDPHAVLLVCGGKDTGKSSFARYAVNRLLGVCPEVFYLDTDLGQAELGPPGCASLVALREPLFGSAFTHLRPPLSAVFVGALSPKTDPAEFFKAVNALYATFRYLMSPWHHSPASAAVAGGSAGPLVVNTQGWVRGLGAYVL